MGPDLDQNLSLKASLHDKVTPVLSKIRKGVRSTREAFSEMVSNLRQKGSEMGEATGDMETKVVEDLTKIQDGLKKTSGAFDDFSGTAKEGSAKVGKALQDAVYTKGAEDKLGGLDKDLGKLDKTFKGMASRQGSISGKARSVAATSSDNINKKVIPAFQELHGTLDDYPDTLEEINRLEQDRMAILEEGQGFFDRISGRVQDVGEGFKDASDELKYGLRDMAAMVSAGVLGVAGARVQEVQTGAARIAGAEAFAQTPELLERATFQARATMDVVEPFAMQLMELQSVSEETMPGLIADFVGLSKATGDSGEQIVALHDQLTNLAGIKGEGFIELQDNMKYFSETTRATWDDMSGVIQVASTSMLGFSEDARKAYAKSTLAASAAAKNMGLAATTPLEVIENLLDNPEAMAKMQGIISNTGQDVDLQALIREGKDAEAFDAIAIALKEQFGQLNMRDMAQRKAVMEMTAGLGFSKDELLRVFEGKQMTGEGVGGTAAEMAARAVEEAPGTIEAAEAAVRGTVTERFEQTRGLMESAIIEPGRKLAETVATAGDMFNEKILSAAVHLEQSLDEISKGRLSSGIAFAAATEVVTTGIKTIGKAGEAAGLPSGITDVMQGSGLVDKLLVTGASAAIVHEVMTAEPVEEQFFQREDKSGRDETRLLTDLFDKAFSKEPPTPEVAARAAGIEASGIDLSEYNMRDTKHRKAVKEMMGGLLTPEEIDQIMVGQIPDMENVVAPSVGVRETVAEAAEAYTATGSISEEMLATREKVGYPEGYLEAGISGGYQNIIDTTSTNMEATKAETPAQVEVTDKQGEKRVTLQEQMLNELKVIADRLKPGPDNTTVKPVYTPGMDRSREYLELDKGYS